MKTDKYIPMLLAFITIVVFALGFMLGSQVTNTNHNNYNSDLIKAYDAYNRDCETLLDSIASHDESFMDTEGETDYYLNYCISRETLDNIINK